MTELLFDLRTAIRQLRKTPAFTAAAILMLALGIGATVAIFSIVNGVLLRPLPFPHADRLISISDRVAGVPGGGGEFNATAQDIQNETRDNQTLAGIGGYQSTGFALNWDHDRATTVSAARFTSGVFPTLGVRPLLGRVFTSQEDTGSVPVAVLSYGLWHDSFQSNPAVLGMRILLDRKPYTVIGVMPRSFAFPLYSGMSRCQLWVPMSFTPVELSAENDSSWNDSVVGRLKPGVTREQAVADITRVDQETMRQYPSFMSGFHISPIIVSLHAAVVQSSGPLLRTLFLAVAVVLLIACANLAGLLLVRALRRRREIAVRIALGARAATLLRQALLESLLLSTAGATIGITLAAVALRFGRTLLPATLPLVRQVEMSGLVVAFAVGVALLTGLLCGIAPALTALSTNMNDALKEGGRTGSGGGAQARLRSALVIGEITVALVLLVASGLLLRSFEKMQNVQLGFSPDHTIVAAYSLPRNQYGTQAAVDAFNREALRRLEQLPGARSAGLTSEMPTSGSGDTSAFVPEGYAPPNSQSLDLATPAAVQGSYFRTMGIPLLRGRYLSADDTANTRLVAVINQKLAEQSWPGENPIGKRLRFGLTTTPTPWITVVGEVANVKEASPDKPSNQQWYFTIHQNEALLGKFGQPTDLNGNSGYIALRTTLPPATMENALRAAIRSIDPQLPLTNMQTMNQAVASTEAPRRFDTTLITIFAAAALLLAILGIYSILAYSVAMRTQEMAIRLALGAQRASVVRLILSSGARLAGIGCAIGLLLAFGAERLLQTLLFGVSATDPLVFALAAVVIFLLALVAAYLPARRAAGVSPVEALRAE